MRTDDILDLESIAVAQQKRTQAIHAVLDTAEAAQPDHGGTPHPALAHALAHHFLEGAQTAAQQRNPEELAWYRNGRHHNLAHLALPTPADSTIIVAPGRSELLCTPLSDTAYYLISSRTQPADDQLKSLTADAIALARQVGFGKLVTEHAAIICLLDRRDLHQTLHSWSLSRLPGTVFTEHADDPWILARDLVHEAGHNWLNDALTATDTKIPDDISYFSPWRNTRRPAFGFIHACWAFFSVDATRLFVERYLSEQGKLLDAAATDVDPALNLLDPSLRTRVAAVVTAARSLRTPRTGT